MQRLKSLTLNNFNGFKNGIPLFTALSKMRNLRSVNLSGCNLWSSFAEWMKEGRFEFQWTSLDFSNIGIAFQSKYSNDGKVVQSDFHRFASFFPKLEFLSLADNSIYFEELWFSDNTLFSNLKYFKLDENQFRNEPRTSLLHYIIIFYPIDMNKAFKNGSSEYTHLGIV